MATFRVNRRLFRWCSGIVAVGWVFVICHIVLRVYRTSTGDEHRDEHLYRATADVQLPGAQHGMRMAMPLSIPQGAKMGVGLTFSDGRLSPVAGTDMWVHRDFDGTVMHSFTVDSELSSPSEKVLHDRVRQLWLKVPPQGGWSSYCRVKQGPCTRWEHLMPSEREADVAGPWSPPPPFLAVGHDQGPRDILVFKLGRFHRLEGLLGGKPPRWEERDWDGSVRFTFAEVQNSTAGRVLHDDKRSIWIRLPHLSAHVPHAWGHLGGGLAGPWQIWEYFHSDNVAHSDWQVHTHAHMHSRTHTRACTHARAYDGRISRAGTS